MARKPDYSKLILRGNGHTQDSFSLAVQAAAGLLGKDADYETIYCLSSNAFAPAVDTGEDCTAWWHVNAALGDRCMQTVARRLGLAARRLPIPELEGHWSDADAVARQRRAGVEVLKEAMDRGEVIVTLGGWQGRQDDRFVPWCWAGVLTEVNYDGTIRGACLNGRQDNLLYLVPSETGALSAADVTLTEQEAGQAALTQAVARIRGDAEPFLPGDWYVYGMKAIDAWIEKMGQTPFCGPCFESAPDQVWTCAINNAQTTTAGAKAAALHLRERLDTFPEAAHSHLEAAATHYDRIAEVLRPALTGEGGEHYRDFIGDLEKQKAHADVLRRVKAELAAAADEMERALAAQEHSEAKPRARREGGKVWVEAVPDLKMTGGRMRLVGMEILLRHRGEKTSFGELLAYSGEAFHLCHGSKWELRTGLSIATDPWADLAQAYGYAWRWTQPSWFHEMTRLDIKERWRRSNEFLDQLWKEIDAGRPVLLGGAYGECGTWRVVVGYDRDKQQVCYVGGDTAYEWADLIDEKVKELGFWDSQVRGPIRPNFYGGWQANAAFLLGERKTSPSGKERGLFALRRAAEMFRANEFHTAAYGGATYYFGEKAYQQWAKDLRELDFPADLAKPRPRVPEWYDMSSMDGQVDAVVTGRTAAAEFCESMAEHFPVAARPHLLAAANCYRDEVEIARTAFDAFLGKITDEERNAWLSDEAGRKVGAAAILRMLEKERAAIAEIERALSAECGQEFSEKQLERLSQWSNMWGDLDGCIRAAGRGRVHFELLRMELALEPISGNARRIRGRMGLEPADLSYPTVIEALLRSIAAGKSVEPWPPARTPERLQRLERLAAALRAWSDGASKQQANRREGADAATVQEVYGYLGTPDEDKKAVVALLVEKLETGYSERAVQLERKGLENPGTLEEALGHNVSMCDTQCWTFEHNLKQLLQRIGSKTMSGGWSEPDGPIGWSGPRAMDPEYKPRLAIIVAGLEAWLAGEAGEGDSLQIVEMLGARDAYNEKEWLVRCLHNYLSHHARGVGY